MKALTFHPNVVTADTVFPESSLNARYSREEIAERTGYSEVLKKVPVRDEVPTLPRAALRWALDQAHVSLALTGAKKVEELRDGALDSEAGPFTRRTTPQPSGRPHKFLPLLP